MSTDDWSDWSEVQTDFPSDDSLGHQDTLPLAGYDDSELMLTDRGTPAADDLSAPHEAHTTTDSVPAPISNESLTDGPDSIQPRSSLMGRIASRLEIPETRAEKLPPHMRQIRERNLHLWDVSDQSEFDAEVDSWIDEIKNGNRAGSRGLKALRGGDDVIPQVSIVIPAHNEERLILQLLQSVAAQNYGNGVEVLVVDNNSDQEDRTASFAERCGARVIKYTVFDDDPDKELSQIALARQKGLDAAKGVIVISTDADVITPDGWIDAMTTPLATDRNVGVVTGDIKYYDMPRILAGQNWARTVGRTALTIYSNKNLFRGLGKSSGNGANSAFRRKDALSKQGYDTHLFPGEDTDLAHRLSEGRRIEFIKTESARVRVSPRRFLGMGPRNVARAILDYRSTYVDPQDVPIHKR